MALQHTLVATYLIVATASARVLPSMVNTGMQVARWIHLVLDAFLLSDFP